MNVIAEDDPRLAAYPRFGAGEWRAWRRLRNAKPFVLDARDGRYFVDGGGWAHVLGREAPTVHASKLLDPEKADPRRKR